MRRCVAVLLVIVVVLGVLALFVVAIVPVISDQIARSPDNAPGWLDELQTNRQVQKLDDEYDVIDKVQDYVTDGDFGERLFGGALGVGLAVLSAPSPTAFIVAGADDLLPGLAAEHQARRLLTGPGLAPRPGQRARRPDHPVARGGYVSGAFIVAICAGLSTLIFPFIVGLGEYAVALAFVVALLDA